ncbi:hypothetical protein RZS08_14895, partial [Arthrospira platensis SPKY1]|nr:hypothetical protein [Arthrospira platensis SPKY1]
QQFQRGLQRLTQVQALTDAAQVALVTPVVVGDVATGSQHAAHRHPQIGQQALGHEVEDGRSTGAQDQGTAIGSGHVEQGFGHGRAGETLDTIHQFADPGAVLVVVAAGQWPFVTLHAHEAQTRTAMDPACQRQGFVGLPATGTLARNAHLQQHRPAPRPLPIPGPGLDLG